MAHRLEPLVDQPLERRRSYSPQDTVGAVGSSLLERGRDIIAVDASTSPIRMCRRHGFTARIEQTACQTSGLDFGRRRRTTPLARIELCGDSIEQLALNDRIMKTFVHGFTMDDLAQIGAVGTVRRNALSG